MLHRPGCRVLSLPFPCDPKGAGALGTQPLSPGWEPTRLLRWASSDPNPKANCGWGTLILR